MRPYFYLIYGRAVVLLDIEICEKIGKNYSKPQVSAHFLLFLLERFCASVRPYFSLIYGRAMLLLDIEICEKIGKNNLQPQESAHFLVLFMVTILPILKTIF